MVDLQLTVSAMATQTRVELMCSSCIRGYVLVQFAVAICGTIVGHVPKKISRVCWLFLRKHNLSELLCNGYWRKQALK